MMNFYNQNQIQILKIKKNEFELKQSWEMFPEVHIEKVIYPFVHQILSQEIKVYLARETDFRGEIQLDWQKYEFILFNIMQNAIKYNIFLGKIVVMLKCERVNEERYVL